MKEKQYYTASHRWLACPPVDLWTVIHGSNKDGLALPAVHAGMRRCCYAGLETLWRIRLQRTWRNQNWRRV